MAQYAVTSAVLERLSIYLNYLKTLPEPKAETISSTAIASALGMGNITVRKDIACVSSSGRPKVGYKVSELILELEKFLGYDEIKKAVLVGAGKLGGAPMAQLPQIYAAKNVLGRYVCVLLVHTRQA